LRSGIIFLFKKGEDCATDFEISGIL